MRVVLTYDDYVALPNDGKRYEIHDGELSVTPSPTFRHQQIVARLLGYLRAHVDAHDLGEVVAAPITVVLTNGAADRFGPDELVDIPPFPGLRIDSTALWR